MSETRFAFCEPSNATPFSREHIRRVGAEGLKLGGGVPSPALCGADLRYGWDLSSEVTTERVARGLGAHVNPTCPDCAAAFGKDT